jgi:hypothetical protein
VRWRNIYLHCGLDLWFAFFNDLSEVWMRFAVLVSKYEDEPNLEMFTRLVVPAKNGRRVLGSHTLRLESALDRPVTQERVVVPSGADENSIGAKAWIGKWVQGSLLHINAESSSESPLWFQFILACRPVWSSAFRTARCCVCKDLKNRNRAEIRLVVGHETPKSPFRVALRWCDYSCTVSLPPTTPVLPLVHPWSPDNGPSAAGGSSWFIVSFGL